MVPPRSDPPSMPVPQLDDNGRRVLAARPLERDSDGRALETPAQLFWRVASAVAAVEKTWGQDPDAWARRFYPLLAGLEFLPNSPTLMNAGRELGQLAACFVLPIEDSVD